MKIVMNVVLTAGYVNVPFGNQCYEILYIIYIKMVICEDKPFWNISNLNRYLLDKSLGMVNSS